MRVTQIVPVNPSRQIKMDLDIGDEQEAYTLGQVMSYLHSADPREALASLQRSVAE